MTSYRRGGTTPRLESGICGCFIAVTRAYTGLWCFKAYETRYRMIFTLVVGDIGFFFCVCVFVVVVDADRLVVNCA